MSLNNKASSCYYSNESVCLYPDFPRFCTVRLTTDTWIQIRGGSYGSPTVQFVRSYQWHCQVRTRTSSPQVWILVRTVPGTYCTCTSTYQVCIQREQRYDRCATRSWRASWPHKVMGLVSVWELGKMYCEGVATRTPYGSLLHAPATPFFDPKQSEISGNLDRKRC